VDIGVMQAAYAWASSCLRRYEPKDEPAELKNALNADLAIHCPRCHSMEVIFEHLSGDQKDPGDATSQKFDWMCGSCGYSWEDDGVETKD
jgi:hypothetical protein